MGIRKSYAGCVGNNVLEKMTLQWFCDNNIDIENCVGLDEVGRGPLAGPVVSAAVWISHNLAEELEAKKTTLPVRDSKKLSHLQRKRLIDWLERQSSELVRYAIGAASVEEIDSINILHAALLSMKRAYENLNLSKGTILVDGNAAPVFSDKNLLVKPIIKGDAKVLTISLASIIAKEYRDSLMQNLAKDFPQYGWQTNVGYGTKEHLDAIRKFGITVYHRKSFAPVRECNLAIG